MIVVDSSVWIALYNELDSQHDKAKKLAISFSNVAIAEYVVLETCTILQNKAGIEAAEKFLAFALDNSDVTILHLSPEFFNKIAHTFRWLMHKKLSFVDISLLLLSESHEIVTFDKALTRTIKKLSPKKGDDDGEKSKLD